MKLIILCAAVCCVVGAFLFFYNKSPQPTPQVNNVASLNKVSNTIPLSFDISATTPPGAAQPSKINQLTTAYPNVLALDPTDSNVIIWKSDQSQMPYDNGLLDKDFDIMLAQPDLEDQLSQLYPIGASYTITKDFDPGRVRYTPFFKKMYGATEGEVKANLTTVYWLPHFGNQPLLVTKINGVNNALQAISDEFDTLLQQPEYTHLLPYLQNPGGTFNWRPIAGTDRLSPHSYGIAIDINSTEADYWRWSADGVNQYQNQVPQEIVDVFEKHGFIWGGKWYHFDTMHFEYRPELFLPVLP